MDDSGLISINPASVAASKLALTGNEFSTKVMRKALDMEASQGASLLALMDQSNGIGRNVDVRA